MPGVTVTASSGVERVAQRLAVVVMPLWLLPDVATALRGAWPVWALAAASGCAVAAAWTMRRRTAVAVWLLAASAVIITIARPSSGGVLSNDLVLEQWLNFVAWAIGLVTPAPRRAIRILLLVLASCLAAMAGVAGVTGVVPDIDATAALVAYALTDGLASVAAFAALRGAARRADASVRAQVHAAAHAATEEARTQEFRRTTRILHDTVVNTLGAVRRWRLDDTKAVQRRAGEDLRLLSAMRLEAPADTAALRESVRRRAAMLGITLQTLRPSVETALPDDVAAALEGACWELLNNVAKHSGVTRASFAVTVTDADVLVQLDDDGRGFDKAHIEGGGGQDSVLRRCREAGIEVLVQSAPGAGVHTELRWHRVAVRPVIAMEPMRTLDADLADAVRALSAVLLGLGLVVAVRLSVGAERSPAMAFALAIGLAYLLMAQRASTLGVARRLPVGVTFFAALIAVAAPSYGIDGCMRVQVWWWGPFAALIVGAYTAVLDARVSAFVALVAGTWAGYAVAIATTHHAVGSCIDNTTVFAVLHAGILWGLRAARRAHTRIWQEGAAAVQQASADEVRAVELAAALQVRASGIGFARTIAEPLLTALADGSADPTDDDVRDRAGIAEEALRAVAGVPSSLSSDAIDAILTLLARAYARSIVVRLSIATETSPAPHELARLTQALDRLLELVSDGTRMQVTVLADGAQLQVILVVPAEALLADLAKVRALGFDATAIGDAFVIETRVGVQV